MLTVSRTSLSKCDDPASRHGRADLEIYLCGSSEHVVHLAENRSRLADEIQFFYSLDYSAIERVAPEAAINDLSRFTDLNSIYLDESVQDIECFLDMLIEHCSRTLITLFY